ncbi:MAG: hydroxymethylglutaryl-CoA reductase [Bacteroidota bacterium]
MFIPKLLLKQLYTYSSLTNLDRGIEFSIKNRLADATVKKINGIRINGEDVAIPNITLDLGSGELLKAESINEENPINFPLRKGINIICEGIHLSEGKHKIGLSFETDHYGELKFSVEDSISKEKKDRLKIPYDPEDNYSEQIIKKRQDFIEEYSGVKLQHIPQYSFDPAITKGNLENFVGVAQVPLGFAGPIHVNGEYAKGKFLVPLATSEGTLVASYNRGIKAVNLSGGVKVTVLDDSMQRAPVFVFEDARECKAFRTWIQDNIDDIREQAEATSSVAKLQYIDSFMANKFVYLRFNFSTGDAAGQNMVGRATFAACSWILDHYPGVKKFYLESNFATDKKASHVNIMRTRGKRVTAEAILKRDVLIQHLRTEPESLHYHQGVSTIGAFFSGANNNGAHSPNAIAAMYIATGQDEANVAESSAGILYTELQEDGNLYVSLTIPSLIVATYGGGTSLPTQRECLEVMGCYGKGKVNKFAEIVAGVALAGELSLGAAISSLDWVSSHEKYGRNR